MGAKGGVGLWFGKSGRWGGVKISNIAKGCDTVVPSCKYPIPGRSNRAAQTNEGTGNVIVSRMGCGCSGSASECMQRQNAGRTLMEPRTPVEHWNARATER